MAEQGRTSHRTRTCRRAETDPARACADSGPSTLTRDLDGAARWGCAAGRVRRPARGARQSDGRARARVTKVPQARDVRAFPCGADQRRLATMTTNTPTRRVLLLSSDDEAIPGLEVALHAGGYEIRRCVAPGDGAFPCVALQPGAGCPLDDGLVDVALDVRSHPWPHPTDREAGVRCALRKRVPLAVAGRTAFSPFDSWASVTIEGTVSAAQACDRAIAASLDQHREVVVDAVRAVLDMHGHADAPIDVHVDRRAAQLHVAITAPVPKELRTIAVAPAGSALRRLAPTAGAIEIDLCEP